MAEERELEIAVQKLAGTYLKDIVSIFVCEVVSVDTDNRTCKCTPIGGVSKSDIDNVQLCAESDNGVIVFPTVGSTVIVALSTYNNAFVLMYSGIDKVQFMDGTYGGMVKVIELTAKINALETLVNQMLAALQGITVTIPSGGGAVPFAPFFPESPLTPTAQADIENDKITHGDI